jgi:hypothetical protein
LMKFSKPKRAITPLKMVQSSCNNNMPISIWITI